MTKYFSGRYAVCETCGEKPCSCPPAGVTPSPVLELPRRPASGNAIPFAIWDFVIAQCRLSVVESSVLLYLCRRTNGYGHHAGEVISVAEIAIALRIGRSSVKRALERLSQLGQIERTLRHEPGGKECAASHIRVTIDTSVGRSTVDLPFPDKGKR